ncbi:MAG: DNA-processing protein DprA [Acidimicrobiales bacterium]
MSPASSDDALAVALNALPAMGPARLTRLVARWSLPEVWEAIKAQRAAPVALEGERVAGAAELSQRWAAAAGALEPERLLARHLALGHRVLRPGQPGYPGALLADPEPPIVLFCLGDPSRARGPAVALVGARRATRHGLDVARQWGQELAAAGVCVVSGLALGIDAAAHQGALAADAAPPAAVVGTGLDTVYPRRNQRLWAEVAERGAVLSEAPLSAPAARWRFPARNRLIAALADVTVVVESRARGGSLHTAKAAEALGRPVLAAPGPVQAPQAEGSNRLLRDGAHPVLAVEDIFTAAGLAHPERPALRRPPPPRLGPLERAVLDAIGWAPASLDEVASRVDAPLGELALTVETLVAAQRVVRSGPWLEQRAARSA